MSNFTPAWFKKGFFNESLFCDDFLSTHQLLYSNGAFFTPDGRMTDTMPLRCEIFEMMREYVGANLAKKVTNVVDVLKLAAQVEDFPPVTDRIALANGTLYLDGTFQEGKPEIVRNRLPVKYDPKAAQPTHWLRFLSDLLYPEDVPTVQEFIGYCLIPSNKGQRMMVIKGSGGEGKSQIGVVLSRLFGCNMKDGSIGKISENRFARADLEHTLLCAEGDTIRLELRSDEKSKAERFPFDFVLTSTFRLEGRTVHHTLTVENPADAAEELRFGIGYHPAFALPFDDRHVTEDYEIRFDGIESPLCVSAQPNGLLNGQSYYLARNVEAIPLTDDLFDNDSHAMVNLRSGHVSVIEKDTGRSVICDVSDFPYTLIWSAAKKPLHFICIEPWHSLPGEENGPIDWEQRPCAASLKRGESWSTTLSTTFVR